MVFLYAICIIRMCIPFELPNFQFVIRDKYIATAIMKPIILNQRINLFYVLLIVSVMVSAVIFIVNILSYRKYSLYLKANRVKRIETDVTNTDIFTCDAVSVPITIGYFKPVIYLPDYSFSDADLKNVIMHEQHHIDGKDLWVLLLTNILTYIFWWNPFVYLLKKELAHSLELKCDYSVTKEMGADDCLAYAETLLKVASNDNSHKANPEMVLGFYKRDKSLKYERVKQRFEFIGSKMKLRNNIFVIFTALLVFFGSYYFIWQASYDVNAHTDDSEYILSEDTMYLQEQEDGSFALFVGGENSGVTVDKNDVESGIYRDYKIIYK